MSLEPIFFTVLLNTQKAKIHLNAEHKKNDYLINKDKLMPSGSDTQTPYTYI